MDCTTCISYPDYPTALLCAAGIPLNTPDLEVCAEYSKRLPSDSTPVPEPGPPPFSIEIAIGSRSWHVFHHAIQALYKNGGISSKTATLLLDTLEGQEKDRSSTLTHWYQERLIFQDAGFSPIGSQGKYLFWHEALDILRDFFLCGDIDMGCLLAALDFEWDASPTVADLVDIWTALRQGRLDSEDVFDHLAYQHPKENLPSP